MVRGSDNSTDSSTTRGTSAAVHKKRRRSSRQEKHPSPDSSTNSSSQSDDRQESVSGTLEGVSHGPSSKRKKRNLPATTTKAAPAIGFHHRLFATPRPSKKRPTVSESNPPSQRSLPQQSTERIPDKIKQIVLGKRFLRKEDPNNGQTCDLHSEDLAGKVQEKSKELNGHASTLNMGHNKRRKRDGRRERHPPPPSQQRVQSKPTNVARTRRYRSFKGALVRVTKGPYKGFVGKLELGMFILVLLVGCWISTLFLRIQSHRLCCIIGYGLFRTGISTRRRPHLCGASLFRRTNCRQRQPSSIGRGM